MTNIDIHTLKSWSKNPRGIKKADFERLKNQIQELGIYKPFIVEKTTNEILGGNMRLKACLELGINTVPVTYVDAPTDELKIKYALSDNDRAGYYEQDQLAELILSVPDLQLDDYKIDLGELTSIDDLISQFEPDEIVEDEAPEVDDESEPVSKLGEVYQLGRHRLMCGDATKIENVEKLMNGQKADMVFTDPPYGMGKEKDGVLNDNLYNDKLLAFNLEWIPLSFSFLKDNGSWYCWGIDEPLMDIYSNIIKPYIKENKATFRNLITWNKTHDNPTYRVNGFNSPDLRSYYAADEKCLFIMKGVQGFNTNQDNYYEPWDKIRLYLVSELEKTGLTAKDLKPHIGEMYGHYFTKSQWTLPTKEKYLALRAAAEQNAFKKEYDEIKKEYYSTRAYFNNTHDKMKDTWTFKITSDIEKKDAGNHATPKPIELCSRAIKTSSRKNEIVLDLFGGSGSTLIACEQLDRACYIMELDPKYCDVIRKRYYKLVYPDTWQEKWADQK